MNITRLRLTNFKNYEVADVAFDHKVNIIYGNNGSGKTNILDAIHFLSVSKSYFGLSDKYLIKDEQDFYRIEGYYAHEDKKDHIVIKYKRDQKRDILLNTKKLQRVGDLIGRFPVVLIAPDDINIVKGGSKERRDYFNKWLCQSDRTYLDALMSYNRLLRQKDALLKGDYAPDRLTMEAYNSKMTGFAAKIHNSIITALSDFIPAVLDQYSAISEGKDDIQLKYLSDLTDQDISVLFNNMIPQEIHARRPLVGVQRDDYEFTIKDLPLKKYGSQGQIKSFLYALRLAEFIYLRKHLKRLPILILDDFFEKLDRHRLSALLSLINSGTFGQVFLSDTELARSKAIFEDRGITFGAYHVTEGSIERDQ